MTATSRKVVAIRMSDGRLGGEHVGFGKGLRNLSLGNGIAHGLKLLGRGYEERGQANEIGGIGGVAQVSGQAKLCDRQDSNSPTMTFERSPKRLVASMM